MAAFISPDAQELWEVLLEEWQQLNSALSEEQRSTEFLQKMKKTVIDSTADIHCPKKQLQRRLATVYQIIHHGIETPAGEIISLPSRALCLSGGGIRSATFNLGLLQGLARRQWLGTFDYMSSVSGGGYIASWLSAWIHRVDGGVHKVQDLLGQGLKAESTCPSASVGGESDKNSPELNVEPPEVCHLRDYTNYLTPKTGVLSGDTWALLATYPRNLLLNWLVALPLVVAAMGFIWLMVRWTSGLQPWKQGNAWNMTTLLLRGGLALSIAGICIAMPLAPVANRRPQKHPSQRWSPKWWDRWHPVILVVLPVYIGSVISAFAFPAVTFVETPSPQNLTFTFLVTSGCMTLVTFFMLWLRGDRKRQTVRGSASICARIFVIYCLATAGMVWSFGGLHSSKLVENLERYPLVTLCIEPVIRLMLAYMFFTIVVGLTSEFQSPDMEETREWWSRLMGELMLFAFGHLVVFGIVLLSPLLLEMVWNRAVPTAGFTLATLISGAFALSSGLSSKAGIASEIPQNYRQQILNKLPGVAAVITLVSMFVLAAWLIESKVLQINLWLQIHNMQTPADTGYASVFTRQAPAASTFLFIELGLIAFALFWAYPINVNRFSLHGTYRMRLTRAYLGASRGEERLPNAFTGFDGKDNIPLHFLRRSQKIWKNDLKDLPALSGVLFDVAGGVHDYIREQDGLKDQTRYSRLKEMASKTVNDFTKEENGICDEIIAALNKLLHDPRLVVRAYGKEGMTLEEAIERAPEQIQFAFSQINADGSCCVCNRLILEDCLRAKDGKPLISSQIVKPFHVINAALNLVGGRKLAWQQRKARSFTFTPLSCGFDLGYRPSVLYANGITLAGAMTVSGAAASPNMGYHSSPAVTALMTLFNVRLGCWLGNPTRRAQAFNDGLRRLLGSVSPYFCPRPTYQLNSPRFSIRPLIDEGFGRTTEDNSYIYLSDGGHFENLGLYEMVRRRCKLILVSDSSCDPECELGDLGNAIRKIRIDLGVPITLKRVKFQSKKKHTPDSLVRYCTVGRILYSAVDGSPDGKSVLEGFLIYFKPTLTGAEPIDVANYSINSNAFPHEPTSDQWFSESQFESYRQLGETAAEVLEELLKDPDDPAGIVKQFADIRNSIETYIQRGSRMATGDPEPSSSIPDSGRRMQDPIPEQPGA